MTVFFFSCEGAPGEMWVHTRETASAATIRTNVWGWNDCLKPVFSEQQHAVAEAELWHMRRNSTQSASSSLMVSLLVCQSQKVECRFDIIETHDKMHISAFCNARWFTSSPAFPPTANRFILKTSQVNENKEKQVKYNEVVDKRQQAWNGRGKAPRRGSSAYMHAALCFTSSLCVEDLKSIRRLVFMVGISKRKKNLFKV